MWYSNYLFFLSWMLNLLTGMPGSSLCALLPNLSPDASMIFLMQIESCLYLTQTFQWPFNLVWDFSNHPASPWATPVWEPLRRWKITEKQGQRCGWDHVASRPEYIGHVLHLNAFSCFLYWLRQGYLKDLYSAFLSHKKLLPFFHHSNWCLNLLNGNTNWKSFLHTSV